MSGASALMSAPDLVTWRLPTRPVVIVRPCRAHRVVAMRCYVRGGSIAEWPDGGRGVAHLVEHVVATEAARELRRQQTAALLNASTARDCTCFSWKATPEDGPHSLRAVLTALARLATGDGLDDEVDAQRGVILEELRLHEADPIPVFRQRFLEHLLLIHPARYPISGSTEALRHVRGGDAAAYLRRIYRPGHVCIVAAGNCEPNALIAEVARSAHAPDPEPLWSLPAEAAEPPRNPDVPYELEIERLACEVVEVGFVTRGNASQDALLLETLSAHLNAHRAGRLCREFDAVDVTARCATTAFGVGFFTVLAAHREGTGEHVEAKIRHWFERLSRGEMNPDLTPDEVDADVALDHRTLNEQTATLGQNEIRWHDPMTSDKWRAAVRGPSYAEQIARVFGNHDVPARLHVGHLRRRTRRSVASSVASSGDRLAITLPNGIRLLALPSVSCISCCQIVGRGGALYEAPQQAGVCNMMVGLWPQRFAPFTDHHFFGLSSVSRSSDLAAGIDQVLECLVQPRYSAANFEALRQRRIVSVRACGKRWEDRAVIELRRVLFRDRAYGRPDLGTPETLRALTLSDVEACHRRLCVAGNLIVAVSGQAATGAFLDRLADRFSVLPAGSPSPEPQPSRGVADRPSIVRISEDGTVEWLATGFGGIPWRRRDWLSLELARSLLVGPRGASVTGRLVESLRSRGLNYSTHCLNRPGFEGGYFAVIAAVSGNQHDRIAEAIDQQLATLRAGAVAAEELDLARALYGLQHRMLYEEPRREAFYAAQWAWFDGDPGAWLKRPEELDALSVEDIAEASGRLLTFEHQAIIAAHRSLPELPPPRARYNLAVASAEGSG